MDVSLEQLRTLGAVVDEGTFERAAHVLGITPSAVSQRIKALEAQVGRMLLTRSKPVRTTSPGDLVLRLARVSTRLAADTANELGIADAGRGFTTLPIAVNRDSLNTWFLPALARMPARHRVCFDLHTDDQEYSDRLFAREAVLAAVTSVAEPVPGCSVTRLGSMRYLPMASVDFVDTYLRDGHAGLRQAPVVQFDRKDSLQNVFLDRVFGEEYRRGRIRPPAHHVPSSADFRRAVELGLGWGMIPELQLAEPAPGLLTLDPNAHLDVELYWQCWNVGSAALSALGEVVVRTAEELLRP